jgi:hypothetical protein
MKPRKLGNLKFAIKAAFIPERRPSSGFTEWIESTRMRKDLADFFLNYTPHGRRGLGIIDFIGAENMRDIDCRYSTTSVGRVVIFASCGDGSHVGVGADSGVPCWVKKGHLQAEHLEDGIVEYPRSLALLMVSATWNRWFPFDPFEAERRYKQQNRRTRRHS